MEKWAVYFQCKEGKQSRNLIYCDTEELAKLAVKRFEEIGLNGLEGGTYHIWKYHYVGKKKLVLTHIGIDKFINEYNSPVTKPSRLKEGQAIRVHRNGPTSIKFSREYGTLMVTILPKEPRPDNPHEEQEWCEKLISWQYHGKQEEHLANDLFKRLKEQKCEIVYE